MGFFDFFTGKKKEELKESLDKGLEKTKDSFFERLTKAVVGKSEIDDSVLDELEEILIGADVGNLDGNACYGASGLVTYVARDGAGEALGERERRKAHCANKGEKNLHE